MFYAPLCVYLELLGSVLGVSDCINVTGTGHMMHPAASSSPADDGTKMTDDLMKGLVPEKVNSQRNGRFLEV